MVTANSGPAVTMAGDPAVTVGQPPGRSIDQILHQARQRLHRLGPAQAHRAMGGGALLINIRPPAQRSREGCVPGALHVERNVLEWRFDPRSDARLPEATGYGRQVIVMCSQGYTSSLAAAALQDLGLSNATDLAGGFQAWARAGLPVTAATDHRSQQG